MMGFEAAIDFMMAGRFCARASWLDKDRVAYLIRMSDGTLRAQNVQGADSKASDWYVAGTFQ
jgi:hypothetical protein